MLGCREQSKGGCRTRTVSVTVSPLPSCDLGPICLVLAGPPPVNASASAAALPPKVLCLQRCFTFKGAFASKRCFASEGSLVTCRCGLGAGPSATRSSALRKPPAGGKNRLEIPPGHLLANARFLRRPLNIQSTKHVLFVISIVMVMMIFRPFCITKMGSGVQSRVLPPVGSGQKVDSPLSPEQTPLPCQPLCSSTIWMFSPLLSRSQLLWCSANPIWLSSGALHLFSFLVPCSFLTFW